MIGILINALLLAAAVLTHFEMLHRLRLLSPKIPGPTRLRVLVALFGAILAHFVEVILFAAGYVLLLQAENYGTLTGNTTDSLWFDCLYFSFLTYTTVGIGDIEPLGPIRFLAAMESLVGFVLLSWTASFMFMEMKRYWDD